MVMAAASRYAGPKPAGTVDMNREREWMICQRELDRARIISGLWAEIEALRSRVAKLESH